MLKKIGIGAVLIAVVFTFTACASPPPIPESAPTPPSDPAPASNPGQTPSPDPAPASSPGQTPSPDPAPAPNSDPASVLNPKPRPSGPIKATWLQVQVDQDSQTVSLPVSELEDNWNIHFNLKTTEGDVNFMAYIFDDEIHVRANVCPPCKSVGFSLDANEDILICDRCATIFDAETGAGIEGACVDYPKASASYETSSGNLIIKGSDLLGAYQETLLPG